MCFLCITYFKHVMSFISVINHLDAQNFCFTINLFHASTCFEHKCSSSGGHNCIIEHLVSSHSVGGCPVHSPLSTCAPDDHLQSVMIPDAV